MSKKVAVILVNYKDYAERYLPDCWEGLSAQDYAGELKIFIVDNESNSESEEYLKKLAPTAEIIKNKNNDGFAKGNNDAMKIALALNYDYVLLLNLDTVIEKNAVSELVKVAESDAKIGAVQARLMLYPEKDKVNSLGNVTHFLGFGYSAGYQENFSGDLSVKDIMYPSGAAVLFSAAALKKVGLFDEEFWMYNEDQDLGWRLWLAGYTCVLAPAAVVYHKYEFSKSIKKFYYMDRNRLIAIWKNYSPLTLVLIFPAFVIMELGLTLFSLKTGWFKEKMRVWFYFLNPGHWPYLIKARQQTQRLREVNDSLILKMISGKIWYQEIADSKLKIINPVFNFYWKLIRGFVCLIR